MYFFLCCVNKIDKHALQTVDVVDKFAQQCVNKSDANFKQVRFNVGFKCINKSLIVFVVGTNKSIRCFDC